MYTFRSSIKYGLYVLGGVLLAGALANIQAWARAFSSLFFSQHRHLKKAFRSNEGAPLTALGTEVSIMTDMVKVLLFIDNYVGLHNTFFYTQVFGCIYKTAKSTGRYR